MMNGEPFKMPQKVCTALQIVQLVIQFSISSTANQVTGVLVDPTAYMDFNDWYIGGNMVGNEYSIAIVDLTLNNPIVPGMGHIADISLYVEPTVPTGNSIEIGIVDMIMADENNFPMYTESINPSIFVGTPMAKFSLDTNLTMSGYAADNITISLDNIVPISVFEMLLKDMPDGLFVTAVNPAGSDVCNAFQAAARPALSPSKQKTMVSVERDRVCK